MKIKCNCGETFEFEVYSFPENQDKDFIRKACPNCHRSYEMVVRLVKENEQFWKV